MILENRAQAVWSLIELVKSMFPDTRRWDDYLKELDSVADSEFHS